MTVCVATWRDGHVWMGADSAGTDEDHNLTVRSDAKLFRRGQFMFACTSSYRMIQILRYRLKVLPRPDKQQPSEYMATTFIDTVRECLRAGGFATKENNREEGGTFLVGYEGKVYEVGDDYQVGENVDQFAAVGDGAPMALGSLYSTPGMQPRKRVMTALKAAERFCSVVRGPFRIKRM